MFKINYWPYAITLMIFGGVIGGYLTIQKAIENPVQASNLFLNNYHYTDKNINEILSSQIEFKSKYTLDYSKSRFSKDGFDLDLEILESGKKVDASIVSIVTRPETREFDKTFNTNRFSFKFPKSGRWIIHIKATVNNLTGYFSLELDSRDVGKVELLNPFISHKRVEKIKLEEERRIQKILQEG